MAVVAAAFNIPLAFHDKLSPTIRNLSRVQACLKVPLSINKSYLHAEWCCSTNTEGQLLNKIRIQPFSICDDGSNNRELQKMNPATVRIHDDMNGHVVTQFLDMCLSSNSTSAYLYNVIDGKLVQLLECGNPCNLCTSVGIDNTSVSIGARDSLKSTITKRNLSVYFCGCPCHIILNTTYKADEPFAQSCGFDVEDFTIDLFYWFDKSTKRKNSFYASVNFVIRNTEGYKTCLNQVAKFGVSC